MRSFIAIKLPEEVKNALAELQKDFRKTGSDVRWVMPENIHLTLKFLGNIKEGDIKRITEKTAESCNEFSAFDLEIYGAGVFPNTKSPRVIWVGIHDSGSLIELQQSIEHNIASLGFEKEKRRFVPHLTLGRFRSAKGKKDLFKEIELHKKNKFGTIPVRSVDLMRSDLSPAGAKYTRIAKISLCKPHT